MNGFHWNSTQKTRREYESEEEKKIENLFLYFFVLFCFVIFLVVLFLLEARANDDERHHHHHDRGRHLNRVRVGGKQFSSCSNDEDIRLDYLNLKATKKRKNKKKNRKNRSTLVIWNYWLFAEVWKLTGSLINKPKWYEWGGGGKEKRGERTVASANIVDIVFGNGFFGQSGIV